jgi:transaldolase
MPCDRICVMTLLDQLRQYTVVVADTGDFAEMARFAPRDATTNPSLILKAAQMPAYASLVADTKSAHANAAIDERLDRLVVAFAIEIAKVIEGRVSMEVDARLSFDAAASAARGRRLVALAAAEGLPRERVLVKLAATWEGIQAAQALQREGIACNLTLLFGFCQAVACAQASVQLISPFVGRIYDWHKKQLGANWDEAAHAGPNDPGVRSVTAIFHYFKRHGIRTEVMGASFRNIGQITALAGCDLLTISPDLLAQLQQSDAPLARVLDPGTPPDSSPVLYNEAAFRYALNADACASEKLAEGIRSFAADATKLEALLGA